jgi:hypothetical protein
MFHAYVERFDVIGGRENILGWDKKVNKAQVVYSRDGPTVPRRCMTVPNALHLHGIYDRPRALAARLLNRLRVRPSRLGCMHGSCIRSIIIIICNVYHQVPARIRHWVGHWVYC